MPDQDFERAFATLAHAELSQKAPGLMPYLIGFQVVDKNDDGSRAAGVFGFKVGDQWYYGPVFWMNGKIRGYDLLYIVGQDLFVPMQEAWVNYITNRRPYVMGEGVLDKNLTQMGVMQPDFTIFRRSPLTKGACAKLFKGQYDGWCHPAAMYLLPSDDKYAGLDDRTSLPAILTKFSAEHTEAVLKAMRNHKFAEAVYKFYTPGELDAVVKSIGKSAMSKKAEPNASRMISSGLSKNKSTKVRLLYGTGNVDPDTANQLTAEQRERLMRGDVVVDDQREAKTRSEVYKNPEYEKVFQTPGMSGIWKVMTRNDGVVDALVGIHMLPIGKAAVTPNASVVIDLGSKKHALSYKQDILARTQIDPAGWDDKYKSFRTAQNVGVGDVGVFVTKDFIVTQPFRVLKSSANPDGSKTLCVSVDSGLLGPKNRFGEVKDDLKPPTQPEIARTSVRWDRVWNSSEGDIGNVDSVSPCGCDFHYNYNESDFLCDHGKADRQAPCDSETYKKRCRGHHIKLVRKPVSMSNVQDTLIVNQDDVRFIPLKADSATTKSWGPWSSLDLAGQADMDVQLRKQGMEKLSVSYDGDNEFRVCVGSDRSPWMRYPKAMETLIVGLDMGEDDARSIMKTAKSKQNAGCMIKRSASGMSTLLGMDPISTYDSTYRSAVQVPMDEKSMIPSNAPYPNMQESMQPIIDQHAQGMAMSASDQGQKEVFDLSVLSSLIRSSGDTDTKIQDMLKDVILGNDRIGRILFLYYWHNDRFTEKYGDKDLSKLEELLRETFKSVGDLVLFLKQKSIEPESVATESAVAL